MKCVELNPKGNFSPWDPLKLAELESKNLSECLGEKLLFENSLIKVWETVLFPGERLPFRKITGDFSFTSLTEGLAVSRCADGTITMVRIKKMDSTFISSEGRELIYDLENIGENLLFFHAIEFKPIVEKVDGLPMNSLK